MLSFLVGMLIGAVFSAVIFFIKAQRTVRVQNQQEIVHRLLASERRSRFDVRSMK
ncbi:hypothetical protein [Marinococcus luteus]|uniref:hypothetical protein n=1 Tax=Marinococcus luteus TaxID=1122204 RepID=UPI002ACC5605|nr:hypothetical protein [Marinococcus luteus]MDZ5782636.1 hypothetical protein [Marinococcus luteus]